MNRLERSHLLAEASFLEDQLNEIGPNAVLTRMSLESRLGEIRESLQNLEETREPAKAIVTFRGRPVLGTHGIMADFGAMVAKAFSDAVSTVAASIDRPLNAMGPIPNKENNRLLITGTATGSFGFEFEEMAPPPLLQDEESAVSIALHRTQMLIESTTESDESLAENLLNTDKRAIDKVKSFLKVLSDAEATCAIERGGHRFSFSNIEQIETSLERLSEDNIHEEVIRIDGTMIGSIPGRRQFEFRPDGEVASIYGTVGPQIEEPGIALGRWGARFTATIQVTRVGNGQAKYQLIRLDRLDEQPQLADDN
ncbi:hypothetical protein [Burkholderia sp. BCC1047]|uniref:hypothetical protein n=1 Tax=Burkholderia sp. BCC1047 TaxID=2676299 RepID=UPI001588943E|nr:hypothetical protein [Burkholderia sp. BCC1047]